jgi:hypothetical protein
MKAYFVFADRLNPTDLFFVVFYCRLIDSRWETYLIRNVIVPTCEEFKYTMWHVPDILTTHSDKVIGLDNLKLPLTMLGLRPVMSQEEFDSIEEYANRYIDASVPSLILGSGNMPIALWRTMKRLRIIKRFKCNIEEPINMDGMENKPMLHSIPFYIDFLNKNSSEFFVRSVIQDHADILSPRDFEQLKAELPRTCTLFKSGEYACGAWFSTELQCLKLQIEEVANGVSNPRGAS